MSTLKDVEYAMRGEQKPAVQVGDYIPEIIHPNQKDPETEGFVVFKTVKSNNGGMHIPGIDYVIDPRTITPEKPNGNGPEMIRLLTGVTTIWAKEQGSIPKEFIDKNVRRIAFPRGTRFITVPTWDTTMIEFMRTARHNVRNPNRKSGSKFEYFEYDPNEVAKEQLAKEMLELDMVLKAKDQTVDKMERHASYLGIALIDEIGRKKPEDRLKTDYILYAKRNPELFKKSLDSKEVDIQFKIRAAILDGKIDISRGDGRAYFGNGGTLICALPANEQPLKVLTDLALTNTQEGKRLLEQLK